MCGRLPPSSWHINQKWLLATLVFIVPFFAASQQDIPEIHIDEIDPYEEELIDFFASRIYEWGPSTRCFLLNECSTATRADRLSCTEQAIFNHIATNLNWDFIETNQTDPILVEFIVGCDGWVTDVSVIDSPVDGYRKILGQEGSINGSAFPSVVYDQRSVKEVIRTVESLPRFEFDSADPIATRGVIAIPTQREDANELLQFPCEEEQAIKEAERDLFQELPVDTATFSGNAIYLVHYDDSNNEIARRPFGRYPIIHFMTFFERFEIIFFTRDRAMSSLIYDANFLTLNSLTKKVWGVTDNMGKRWLLALDLAEEMMEIISVDKIEQSDGQTGFIAFEIHSLTLDGGEEFKKRFPTWYEGPVFSPSNSSRQ